MGFGQASDGSSTTSTIFLVGIGLFAGIAVVAALGEANRCPRLRHDYQRALTSRGEEHKLVDWYLGQAQSAGCRWTRRFPFEVE